MAEATRQLVAIMFTDIVGYTALMGKDSNKALELIRISKEIQKPLVVKHNGKWLKEMGDGAMAQFSTALDAVNCSIEIQKTARGELDAKLRIGIHLGDVTVEENDVHGDGVNVASRLESIADPGGIYISDAIQNAVRGQTKVQAKYLGEVELKNVDYGVRTYALQGNGLPEPTVKLDLKRRISKVGWIYMIAAFSLISLSVYFFAQNNMNKTDDNSAKTIAVLPFRNLSSDPETQYFVDGIMDVILSNLSRIADLQVTSRTSVEQYRDRKPMPTAQQIGRELNVNFLVEASVQKFDNQIKIVVQLIDANQDRNLWAETYNAEWKDVLTLQSNLSLAIVQKLNTRISNSEINIMKTAHNTNPLAQDYLFKAMELSDRGQNELAIHMAEKAIAIDSNYALAWHKIGWIEAFLYLNGRKDNKKKIKDAFDRALMLNPDLPEIQDGPARYLYAVEFDYIGALKLYKELDKHYPNNVNHNEQIARTYRRLGDFEKADQYYQVAIAINPRTWVHWREYGIVLMRLKKYHEAEQAFIKGISANPGRLDSYFRRAELQVILDGDFKRAKETTGLVFLQKNYWDLAQFEILYRNFDLALELIKYEPKIFSGYSEISPQSLRLALINYWVGNNSSKTLFQESLDTLLIMDTLQTIEGEKRYDWRIHTGLGKSYAALGFKQKALESVKQLKIAFKVNDGLVKPLIEFHMIQIYLMVKEYDMALDLIKKQLDGPGIVETSISWLQLHPIYDPLRELPEFQAILDDPKYQVMKE